MTVIEILDAALGALAEIERRVRGAQTEVASVAADTRWQAQAVATYRRKADAIDGRLGLLADRLALAQDELRAMRTGALGSMGAAG